MVNMTPSSFGILFILLLNSLQGMSENVETSPSASSTGHTTEGVSTDFSSPTTANTMATGISRISESAVTAGMSTTSLRTSNGTTVITESTSLNSVTKNITNTSTNIPTSDISVSYQPTPTTLRENSTVKTTSTGNWTSSHPLTDATSLGTTNLPNPNNTTSSNVTSKVSATTGTISAMTSFSTNSTQTKYNSSRSTLNSTVSSTVATTNSNSRSTLNSTVSSTVATTNSSSRSTLNSTVSSTVATTNSSSRSTLNSTVSSTVATTNSRTTNVSEPTPPITETSHSTENNTSAINIPLTSSQDSLGNDKDSHSSAGVIFGAIIGSFLGVALVGLVGYFLCGLKKGDSFHHRRLYEDIRNEPVLRLDNAVDPYDLSYGNSAFHNPSAVEESSYHNHGGSHDFIPMDDMTSSHPSV
ncbi:mucin-15 isoform X2 [Rhinatrema bivittatum]|nr:mucin-15 isoform X2 [Rhinatrema bivittatum]XP_029438257.1 mucin-15 isoform X2 [Rhinatrema bivittatum]XP_029438258.1 mucin-15 isoform X2 [Rhinatrema bivittatum]XP_029438259.1 mucin-15 isoform X2 [Rhinatrema bivittatum]